MSGANIVKKAKDRVEEGRGFFAPSQSAGGSRPAAPERLPLTVEVETVEAPTRWLVRLSSHHATVIVGEHDDDDDVTAVDHARELAILNGWALDLSMCRR